MSEKPQTPPGKSQRDPILEQLLATYAVFKEARPLAIGVHRVIQERQPELTKEKLGKAMKIHTSTTRYLKAVAKGGARYDLDGQAQGDITPEQQAAAAKLVEDRAKRQEEKRQAERARQKEEEAQRKAAEQLARREAKLKSLVDKFGRN